MQRDRLRDWAWRQSAISNLSASSHRLLLWLVEQANLEDLTLHISQHDIARAIAVHPSGISRLRATLEARGLVTTVPAVGVGLGRQLEWRINLDRTKRARGSL